MKYLWRRRVRSRAGGKRSMSSSIVGAGPAPSGVTTPGSVDRRASPAASSRRGVTTSPSSRTSASSAPAACSSSSSAMNEPLWPPPLGLPGEVEHLRHVGQVVEREPDGVRREVRQLSMVVGVSEDLQIEQAHLVAGRAHGGRDALEADRLQAQEDFRVHQRAWMDEKDFHRTLLYPCSVSRACPSAMA